MIEAAQKNKWYFVVAVSAFMLGVFTLSLAQLDSKCHKKYEHINQMAVCSDKVIDKRGYLELKTELQNYIEAERSAGRLELASVYFRDLNNGPVLGINEQANFSSASLLKLPIAIALLKEAENDPTILNTVITNNPIPSDLIQAYIPADKLKSGQTYTLEEILRYQLIYSDNQANNLIINYLWDRERSDEIILRTLRELGLILPHSYEDQDISTRAYASLFRLLYHISYLDEESSEKILSILAESDFNVGLERGVPDSIQVAHKFGERYYGKIKQLHDCGIIYFPRNPYLLCVMTQGKDFSELSEIITAISKMFYEEVNSRKLD